jgi:hypothetical protein
MHSEIGSNFWLNPAQQLQDKPIGSPECFRCFGDDYVWLSTGRSAIRFVIEAIECNNPDLKKVAVLPSYTCDTVFEPFLKKGYEVYYYPVEKNLTTISDTILQVVIEYDASIVLFHRYFGFDTLDGQIDNLCATLRKLGKYSIEDCTQCLYSDIHRSKSDYLVGSIRKWTGTPDGGFVVSRRGLLNNKPYKEDKDLENAKIKASYAKYRYLFDHQGDKNQMLAMYRKAEKILNQQTGIFAISSMSAKVQVNLDINELINKRRENFKVLSQSLCHQVQPLFILESTCAVPLYFPICVEDRDSFQKYLVENAIYAPVVWPKDEKQPEVCDSAEYLYRHLLCIPIDQRYGTDDMYRIVEVINNLYSK